MLGPSHHRDALASPAGGMPRAARLLRARWVQPLVVLGLISSLAVGVGLIVVRPAGATPYTVCASGCAYTSIAAAVSDIHGPSLITVGPGTYGQSTGDAHIAITRPLTLQGAGAGQSVINAASAYNGSAAGSGVLAITNPGGNVTITGFTVEGARLNDSDPNADGILLSISDTQTTDTITVSHNLFYNSAAIDPGILDDQVDAIVLENTAATYVQTNNTFQGVFRGDLIEGSTGQMAITGNVFDALSPNYDPTSTPATFFMPEGVFFALDGDANSTNADTISGNTFKNYAGQGITLVAGFAGLVGAISNVTIASNVLDLQGIAGPFYDSPAIWLRANATSDAKLTSSISNVTVRDNLITLTSSTGHGFGIRLNGNIGSGIALSHNALRGGGSGAPADGVILNNISVASNSNHPNISITSSVVTGFADGIASDPLPNGAQVSASTNCLFSNTTAGLANGDGVSISANGNWWGTASGPFNASFNPSGTGNAVSSNVTTPFSFLAASAPACTGPVATNLAENPTPLTSAAAFTLTANLSTTTTSNFDIAAAQYNVDGGSYASMSAHDGTFDEVTEAVAAHLSALAAGTHTLCVRGTDVAGNLGTATCARVSVTLSVPGEDVMGSGQGASAPQSSGAQASGQPNTGAPSGTAAQPASAQGSGARPASQPATTGAVAPSLSLLIGAALVLLALAGLGIVGYRVVRRG